MARWRIPNERVPKVKVVHTANLSGKRTAFIFTEQKAETVFCRIQQENDVWFKDILLGLFLSLGSTVVISNDKRG